MLRIKWLTEEKYTLQEAHKQGVSLKIIAQGLGRSESAVSKQLARLGIRLKKKTSGPSKGAPRMVNPFEEQRQKIEGIISHVFSDQGLECLKLRHDALVKRDRETNVYYNYKATYDALGETWSYPTRRRKRVGRKSLGEDEKHSYKSLIFVESWARDQGFAFERLDQPKGFPLYIIEGRHRSHAQFCLRINQRRLDQRLPALVVEEWQEGI